MIYKSAMDYDPIKLIIFSSSEIKKIKNQSTWKSFVLVGLLGRERDPPTFLIEIKNHKFAMKKIKPQEESEDEINK